MAETDTTQSIEAPKPGTETSSYKLVWYTLLFTLLAPLPPLVAAVVVQKAGLPGAFSPLIEQTLTQMLVGLSGLLGVSGAYATAKALPAYIQQRGKVAEIKALAVTGLNTAATVLDQQHEGQK